MSFLNIIFDGLFQICDYFTNLIILKVFIIVIIYNSIYLL
jgi:hypothetical protein